MGYTRARPLSTHQEQLCSFSFSSVGCVASIPRPMAVENETFSLQVPAIEVDTQDSEEDEEEENLDSG